MRFYRWYMYNANKSRLTDIEFYGVDKVDECLALNKVNYDDVQKLRNKTDVEGDIMSDKETNKKEEKNRLKNLIKR